MNTDLTEKENNFIFHLLDTGSISLAAEAIDVSVQYAYTLRKKLAKYIVEAAQDYLSIHAVKASKKIVDSIDEKMPNSNQIQAAIALLDRVGISKKDGLENQAVKANIFILPDKKELIIEHLP